MILWLMINQHVEMITSDAPQTSCRRSYREKRSSTLYSHYEYIVLTNMGEPQGYYEVMLDTHRYKWKELIVNNHEFLRSVAGRKPVKCYFTLSYCPCTSQRPMA